MTQLTEEVVFPLVRRKVHPREEEAATSGTTTRRVIFVQTLGLVLFVAAASLLALTWLVR